MRLLPFVAVLAFVACGGDDASAPDTAAGAGAAGQAASGAAGQSGAGAAGATSGAAGATSGAAGTVASGSGGAAGQAGASSPCDPVAQTCPAGAASKCTLLTIDGKNTTGCVEPKGAVAEGEACKRELDGPAGFGRDDCAPGLFCTFIGVLPPSAGGTRRCRTLCHLDATCPTGQRCASLDDASPPDGFCGETCEAFATTCPSGLECSRLWPAADPGGPPGFLTCRWPGAKPAGAACDPVAEDCVAGHVCVDPILGAAPACLPLCDAAHPCAKGDCVQATPGKGPGVCYG